MKTFSLSLIFLMIHFFSSTGYSQTKYTYPFQNPDLPPEERIDNLISLMTLDEKVACLSTNPGVPRLGLTCTGHVEGLHGLAMGEPGGWGGKTPVPTTTFPQAIGMGETWDPELVQQAGAIEGYEVRFMWQSPKYKKGGLVVRAPNADLGRDPRWGRTEECFGEDAYFNGTMAVAMIRGLQGNHPKYWQSAALMKHFLANSNENGRDSSSSDFDERLFREYYSVPFRKGVQEGGSRAYMAAYNAWNGVPCTVNDMLKNITVKEWGQNGIICTDGGAYGMLVTKHKYYPDYNKAANACIKAGINQFLDRYREGVYGALANKYLSETEIEHVIRGNFRVMIKLGLFDPQADVPYAAIGRTDTVTPWNTEKHKAFARLATQKSIVLLKNSKKLLPLDKKSMKSIAVVGPRANTVLLDWYSGTPPYEVSPLRGIRKKLGKDVAVNYSAHSDTALLLAKSSDYVIVCVGNHPTGGNPGWAKVSSRSEGREAVDREVITLDEEEWIKKLYAANPKTIVVLISSFPYAINWTKENIPAIVHMTHNSQELGNALADVLFGDYNPGGRLVQTWPKSSGQLLPVMDYNIRNGSTYMYFKGEPLYPFGYGLSYTTFVYSNFRTGTATLSANDKLTVSVDISNAGKYAGDEVVQLYVKHLDSKVTRPLKELKGFKRVTLLPNETKTVQITLDAGELAYWDTDAKGFVVEEDQVQIMVGSSSADIKFEKQVRVKK